MILSLGIKQQELIQPYNEGEKLWTTIGPPTDNLEDLMWGKEGLPPPPAVTISSPPMSPQRGVKSSLLSSLEPLPQAPPQCNNHNKRIDPIISPTTIGGYTITGDTIPTDHVFSDSEDEAEEGAFSGDKLNQVESGITDIVWKKRGGLGKLSPLSNWERRMLVLSGSRLQYFQMGHDGTTAEQPRGSLNLEKEGEEITVETKGDGSAPSDFEVIIKKGEGKQLTWRFAFDSALIQKKWLVAIMEILGQKEMKDDIDHGLHAGDHIIRWEILPIPVAYPIQIHGIVLEAGKNCVIIADFGMTSYYQSKQDAEENPSGESKDALTAAWDRLRPKDKQRLNVVVLTDPKEIKKWSKINYGKSLSGSNSFFSWFHSAAKEEKVAKPIGLQRTPNWAEIQPPERMDSLKSLDDSHSSFGDMSEPDWFRENIAPSRRPAPLPEPPSPRVFTLFPHDESLPPPSSSTKPREQKLPKSDPPKIVLARTNFLLEFGESILPPYHVFYSNSECIAVWCKTGRWSTLQAAVFLHATAIGNAKSATALTLSLAAVNLALIPVMAVGGLAMVGAPWYILKKSREKSEEATRHLTDLFWAWAPPDVFVEAIECWGGLLSEEELKERWDET